MYIYICTIDSNEVLSPGYTLTNHYLGGVLLSDRPCWPEPPGAVSGHPCHGRGDQGCLTEPVDGIWPQVYVLHWLHATTIHFCNVLQVEIGVLDISWSSLRLTLVAESEREINGKEGTCVEWCAEQLSLQGWDVSLRSEWRERLEEDMEKIKQNNLWCMSI